MDKRRIKAIVFLCLFVMLLVGIVLAVLINTEISKNILTGLISVYIICIVIYMLFFRKNSGSQNNTNTNKNENNNANLINEDKSSKDEMVELEFGFDKEIRNFLVKRKNLISVVHQNEIKSERDGIDAVRYALENPIGASHVEEVIGKDDKTVIITSDVTRPMPTAIVLPVLIDRLDNAGIPLSNIKVVFALGSHRKQTPEEMRKLVGDDVFQKVECLDSDPDDCINLGQTSAGTPIDITRVVAEADKVICLGNIEYHYFAGYSGGAKALMPGVSSRNTIQANHSAMILPDACAGNINSPVRKDLEESAQYRSIDYILNVVLDQDKKIVYAVAGDFIEAHRNGCRFLDTMYSVKIPMRADIVLTTPGGYPKDLNVYQSQKALDNSKNAVKDGGVIILVASCHEGLGEKVFERWINEAKTSHDLIERVKEKFELGGHKAAAIAMVMEKADVYLVSNLDDNLVKKMFMTPFKTIDEALNTAYAKLGEDAKIIAMPHGSSTLVSE